MGNYPVFPITEGQKVFLEPCGNAARWHGAKAPLEATITAIKRKYIYVEVPAVHGTLKFFRDTLEYCDVCETNSSYVMYPSKEEYEAEIDTREKEQAVVGYFRDYTMNKIRGRGLSREAMNTIYRLIQEVTN
jgi:hypothetical protein